ncbi:DUF4012 domain-containing protein [Patescibacteria group bacterium]|nr:DUF4012 domain-containing protein [Patescibacteria group bacterium]
MTPPSVTSSNDLEALLAGVLEQDGVTMLSSDGIRRRARRLKKHRPPTPATPSVFFDAQPIMGVDEVAELDRASVNCAVASVEGHVERTVTIATVEHERSAYVLSLRGSFSARRSMPDDARVSPHEAFVSGHVPPFGVQDSGVYGTLTQDLRLEGIDPHDLRRQFTHGDFRMSYRMAYGRLGRLRSFVRSSVGDLVGLFQRVERVERHVADEVQDTLHVIDIRRFSLVRGMVGFIALLLVVTLPANAVVLVRSMSTTQSAAEGAGNLALQDLTSAKDAGDLSSTIESLKRASSRFREADALLGDSHAIAIGLASVVPDRYRTARALLEVGDKSSEAARILALAFDKVFHDPSRRIDERLDVLAAYARGVLPLLADASAAAADVDVDVLPADKREQFTALAGRLDGATASVREFAGLADFLSMLSGKEGMRTYLLVFQNQTELRPSGGFMGSVAELTLDRGKITRLRVPPGGTYDLKGQLLSHVISPEPLHLINAHWQFQDANWSPDFPSCAEKIRWFWSRSGQPTLDGVIAVNASFMEKLLDVTGPIEMPAYGKTVTRSNFLIETQKAVELEYDKEANTPKQFISDLADALRERTKAFGREEWMQVAMLVSESLTTKDIQVALSDPEEEALAERYGWNGQMKATDGDSLAIIEANIAGQKTDGVVTERVDHLADLMRDGSIEDRVTLVRTHTGSKGELFRGVRNVTYVRFYVPLGSELLEASGFEAPPSNLFKVPDDDYIPDADVAAVERTLRKGPGGADVSVEGDRTVFGGWLQLDPGASQTVSLRYRLPFTVTDIRSKLDASPESEGDTPRAAYSLLLTSQSGKTSRRIVSTVRLAEPWTVVWSRGVTEEDERSLTTMEMWDRDRVVAALITSGDPQNERHEQEETD